MIMITADLLPNLRKIISFNGVILMKQFHFRIKLFFCLLLVSSSNIIYIARKEIIHAVWMKAWGENVSPLFFRTFFGVCGALHLSMLSWYVRKPAGHYDLSKKLFWNVFIPSFHSKRLNKDLPSRFFFFILCPNFFVFFGTNSML